MASETVLVVDDDAEIRDALAGVLEREGYAVVTAVNGVEALSLLRSDHPSCMLLDLMMPVMSGWEVLEELEQTGELDSTPIIVVSAMCAPGVRACLRKPVDLDELLTTVARCCRNRSTPPPPRASQVSRMF